MPERHPGGTTPPPHTPGPSRTRHPAPRPLTGGPPHSPATCHPRTTTEGQPQVWRATARGTATVTGTQHRSPTGRGTTLKPWTVRVQLPPVLPTGTRHPTPRYHTPAPHPGARYPWPPHTEGDTINTPNSIADLTVPQLNALLALVRQDLQAATDSATEAAAWNAIDILLDRRNQLTQATVSRQR